jgi:hypothetical protein
MFKSLIVFFFIEPIAKFYSVLIKINLFFLSKDKNKIYSYTNPSFGETFEHCLFFYNKTQKNSNILPLSFGNFNQEIVSFFFKKYKNILFKIFFFLPYYRIVKHVHKSKYYKPNINFYANKFKIKDRVYTEKIINDLLDNHIFNNSLTKFCKKKYICIFIKHYNFNTCDIIGSKFRQTAELKKIIDLINFLKKKNIKTMILGTKNDKGTIYFKKLNLKGVYFMLDFSDKLSDLLYIIKYSLGYIGSLSGLIAPFFYSNKKLLCIDAHTSYKSFTKYNNLRFVYKKIIFNNKKERFLNVNDQYLKDKSKFRIKESSFIEIKKELQKFFFVK